MEASNILEERTVEDMREDQRRGLSLSNQQVLSGRDAIVDTKFFAGVCISECFSFALEAFCLFW